MSSSLFGSSHGLEEFEKDGIEQAMARIEWASSQIQKKVKYKRPVGVEQKEIETNLSQLISTILAWAQRPLPTTNQRSNQLPPDARRLIRHIFHLTEKALSVNEISSEFGKMLDEKARELVEILRIDPIDSSSIWEPPGIEGDDGDDPNLKGPYHATNFVTNWEVESASEMVSPDMPSANANLEDTDDRQDTGFEDFVLNKCDDTTDDAGDTSVDNSMGNSGER